METLFRFNIIREPNRSRDEIDPIDLTANSQFQNDAGAIPNGPGRRDKLRALAGGFINSDRFVSSINKVAELRALEEASTAIDGLIDAGTADRAAVEAALNETLGDAPGSFIAASAVQDRIDPIKDSILAIKLSPEHHKRPIRRLAAILRVAELAARFDADPAFPRDLAELVAVHRRGMRVPGAVLPARPSTPPRPERDEVADRLKALAARHELLGKALDELRGVRPHGYSVMVQEAAPERLPPADLRPTKLFEQEVTIRQASLRATLLASVGDVTRPPGENQTTVNIGSSSVVREALKNLTVDKLGTAEPALPLGRGVRIALTGSPDFKPVMPGLVGLRLAKETTEKLSGDTRDLMKELGLDPGEPVARTVQKLTAEKHRVHSEAQRLIQPIAQRTFRRIGNTTVAIASSPMPVLYSMSPSTIIGHIPDILFPVGDGVPTTHADIESAGIMDLLLVKQQLTGYEGAEVSHIANILKGEKKDRVHRTRLETETIILTEREVETTTERSLETTDRFEIRRESEKALQEETAVKGSASIKASYGPTVEFRASVEASWERKSQEAERAASETARQATQKASEKITERVLTRETRRVTREIEEMDQHTFDNTAGSAHVSGVYQWVTKVYEAQVFNYGPRTLFDIMIPEPAALLMEAFRSRRSAAIELEKPPAFDLNPSQLTEDNYETYVTLYGATDVKSPPEPLHDRIIRLQHRRRGQGPGVHQFNPYPGARRLSGDTCNGGAGGCSVG
ncbi:MAG: hypothetical protein H0X43_12105 [Nitrosospira sp.]|nr:hypothetical protein [Nitrosospira sp.]